MHHMHDATCERKQIKAIKLAVPQAKTVPNSRIKKIKYKCKLERNSLFHDLQRRIPYPRQK